MINQLLECNMPPAMTHGIQIKKGYEHAMKKMKSRKQVIGKLTNIFIQKYYREISTIGRI